MKPRVAQTNWDAIVTSSPLNTDAAIARDGRGAGWEPDRKFDGVRSMTPLPLRTYTDIPENDITGKVYGRLTVIGLSERKGNACKGAAWVVRCACGAYEHRTKKGLSTQAAIDRAMCRHCDYLEEMKAGRVRRKPDEQPLWRPA